MTQGSLLLDGLKTRLQKVTETNGYPLTVKQVIVSHNQMTLSMDPMKCPIVEIVQGIEEYEHKTGGSMEKWTEIGLRLVAAAGKDDAYMETFKSAIIRNIYADGYDKGGNDGIIISERVVHPRLVRCVPDYGVIEANRIYVLVFEIKSTCNTWRF